MTRYEEFYSSKISLKGSGTQRTANCPFCRHKNDLSINVETGQCKCFQCDFKGDAFSFLQELENKNFAQAKEELMKHGVEPITERKGSEVVSKCKDKRLPAAIKEEMSRYAEKYASDRPDDFLTYLKEVRGLSDEVIEKYQLGFTEYHPNKAFRCFQVKNFLTIPIRKKNEIVNIRCHATTRLNKEHPKDLPFEKGLPDATYLFPEENLKGGVQWLTEGEPDCLCTISHGLNAVTVTGGAGTMPPKLAALFKDKLVFIVYDCDQKGRQGALSVARKLNGVAGQIRIIDLGLKGTKKEKDLTHFFVDKAKTKEDLEKLASETAVFNPTREETSLPEKGLEKLLLSYWEDRQDKRLLIALAGHLLGLDWPWPTVHQLIQRVGKAAKDEEEPSSLKELKIQYSKWKEEAKISYSPTLKDILTVTDLEKLQELAKEFRIPREVRMIDRIRCQPTGGRDGKDQFIIDREVCEAVVRDLREKGRFLQVVGGKCYWFNDKEREVMAIESQMMETTLDINYGINPADRLIRNVVGSLRTETFTYGEEVRVYRLAHYDMKSNILYVFAGQGLVYRLNSRKILMVNNGDDGIFFEEIEREACWEADFSNPKDPFEVLMEHLSFASGEGVVLTPVHQRIVLWLWLRSLFFEEIQPTKPILVLTGDHGSGKTTALRRILYLLFGPKGEVSSVKDEQAWTPAITSNYLLVLDNVDKRLKWLPDKLNLAATGQNISIRVLYETNREYKVTPRCFLALTTVKPPFGEAPVVDRFILLKMKPLDKYISEKAIKRDVLSERNQLWAGLLGQLNSDVASLTEESVEQDFRMADWAELCHKLLSQEKNGVETFKTIINGLKQEQSAQILDYSTVPQILDKWEHDGSEWYSTAELHQKWKEIADIEDLLLFKSVKGLGMHLSNIRKALHDVHGVNYRNKRRTWEYQFPTAMDKEL